MDLTQLSDEEFHQASIQAGEKLNAAMLTTLNYLNENERRRYYSNHDCSSVHEYAVKFMKMDDSTASRHLTAARLLREIPELEIRILSGTTPMTSVSEAGSFFRKEERLGKTFDIEEKRTLLLEIDSQSTRKAKVILLSKSASPEIHFREKITPKTERITELTTYLDQETMAHLHRLKEIWSHAMPHANFADLIKRAVSEAVESHDLLKKAERSHARKEKANSKEQNKFKEQTKFKQKTKSNEKTKSEETPEFEETSKPNEKRELNEKSDLSEAVNSMKVKQEAPISAPRLKADAKHNVWLRDQGRCTFVNPRTGECCESRHFVEEDHIIPKAMGGGYTVENLRLRCRAHNQRHAINSYGADKMSQYLN